MSNHYHLQVETPEPNLVAGMKWFQGTYTQRFHSRNRTCGHLFQGRYKAIPVSGDEHYMSTLSTYIHLNPVRAGIREVVEGGLNVYPWSSYPFYVRKKRPDWLNAVRILDALGFSDTPRGRSAYKKYMSSRVSEVLKLKKSKKQLSEWKEFQRGWFVGDLSFRKFLEDKMDSLPGKRESFAGEEVRKHDEQEAEALLQRGLDFLGVSIDELRARKYGDPDKCLIAWLIHGKTSVPNQWICEQLSMGRVDCFSRYPRMIEKTEDRKVKRKKRDIERFCGVGVRESVR
jgi:hypothetical protein